MADQKDITGLILAGGRGSRMGGVDKGLQMLAGQPLAAHVLARLRPQVDTVLINANRNLADYAALGWPVVPDADMSFSGPLAGLLAGMRRAHTEWLLCAPCDAPRLPSDLAARLAMQATDVAIPVTADGQLQPVFSLVRCSLHAQLIAYLDGGGRKVESWLRSQNHALVPFDRPGDQAAFFNANSPTDLEQLDG